jgi:hypothetical protein
MYIIILVRVTITSWTREGGEGCGPYIPVGRGVGEGEGRWQGPAAGEDVTEAAGEGGGVEREQVEQQ